MESVIIPKDYNSKLDVWQTEHAIKFVKDSFQLELSAALHLRRITAPLAVMSGKGLNDNLNGTEPPVSFKLCNFPKNKTQLQQAEIVQSLAKWKRYALWRHHITPGLGIYTDMNALRPNEITDNIHSIYVDQWDWEKVIQSQERTTAYLYKTVKEIYHAIRERVIAKEYGAVFIRGIGGELSDGSVHDDRSPDYDDWSTPTDDGYNGLNGDIIVWNPVLEDSFEISSMGIRVSPSSLEKQLKIKCAEERKKLYFHKLLLDGKLPQTIGGGIGQSRLCMLLLHKYHIGEVQAGIWPDDMIEAYEKRGIFIY